MKHLMKDRQSIRLASSFLGLALLPLVAYAANEMSFVCEGGCDSSDISFSSIFLGMVLLGWIVAGEFFALIYLIPAYGALPCLALLWLLRGDLSFRYIFNKFAFVYILSWVLGYLIHRFIDRPTASSQPKHLEQTAGKDQSEISRHTQPKTNTTPPISTVQEDSNHYVGNRSDNVAFNVRVVLKEIEARGWKVEHDGKKWSITNGDRVYYAYAPTDIGRFWADHKYDPLVASSSSPTSRR